MIDYKRQLAKEGTVVIPKEDLPLSPQEWSALRNLYDRLEYEVPPTGDTDEKLSLKVFRVKKPSNDHIYSPCAFALLNSPKLRSFLERELDISSAHEMDRCQMHVYEKGDFIAKHSDQESCQEYTITIGYAVNDEYEGGEFITYGEKTVERYKLKAGSIIITKSHIAHEVLPIAGGKRLSAVGFLKPAM